MPIPPDQQIPLVDRLTELSGGSYSPETRRKYYISGPQWAYAYEGHALFHAATRRPVPFEEVIRALGEIGIPCWTTHDTDVIPTDDLMTDRQAETVGRIKSALEANDVRCSMVTCETFHHPVFAASAAAEAPEVREYAARRLANTVDIGHDLGADFAVYWPGTLGYMIQGAIDETQTLRWFADGINAACERDIVVAKTTLEDLFHQHGQIPLPPYIKRPEGSTEEDRRRYQTKYAKHTGSVAAPTAGLHFSDDLLEKIRKRGIVIVTVTLHVGYGTFSPVRCEDIRDHRIHSEYIQIPPETAETINEYKRHGSRVWAVGTTAARALEFTAHQDGTISPFSGLCDLYIYPGYTFRVVDNLITNFHLPQSSLLFLVSALAEQKRIMGCYTLAIEENYRFFSYGDAMAIITKTKENSSDIE